MRTALILQMSLLLSAMTAVYAGEGFPEFSWNHVPVYAHCSADPEFFKPEHYDFLAKHFAFVTFAAGMKENAETGMAQAAAEVKKRNPAVKVLFYFTGSGPHSNFTVLNASFPKDGFLDPIVKKTRNPKTGKKKKAEYYFWDKSRSDVQEWWAAVAQKAVKEYGCDGIFADGLGGDPGSYLAPEKRAAIIEGTMAMCKLAHEKMGPKGLIIFNPLHGEENAELLPVTDGAMIDNFDRTLFRSDDGEAKGPGLNELNIMAEDIEAMSKASKEGKIVIFKGWPGFHQKDTELMKRPHEELVKMAQEYITFPLAGFLVAAGPNCYFQYTWGWKPEYGTFDWYPEFDKPLGTPKGEAIRKGWTYQREFEHASVFVDLEAKTAKINWY